MIALRNNLPLVEDSKGIATAFETAWLQEALERAAEQAGYQSWWLADDLVQSVTFYLANCYTKNVIPEPQLENAVRMALREIGYGEVARFFGSTARMQRVSLLRCLPNTSVDGPEGFFERLAEYIENLQRAKSAQFHFYDLQSCISVLQGVETAGEHSRESVLRDRIVGFVRRKVEMLIWNQNVHCSIS